MYVGCTVLFVSGVCVTDELIESDRRQSVAVCRLEDLGIVIYYPGISSLLTPGLDDHAHTIIMNETAKLSKKFTPGSDSNMDDEYDMQQQPMVYTSITLVGLNKIGWHHSVGRLDRIIGSTLARVIDFGAGL